MYSKDLISFTERKIINVYIAYNRPSEKEWSISTIFYPERNKLYYWTMGKLYPRVVWLKKHIKKNS